MVTFALQCFMLFTWRDEKSAAKNGISGSSSTLLVIASEFITNVSGSAKKLPTIIEPL
ncbi:hypothetical protein [Lactobacillus delbrueckii]|uniref:hypothetical protein n=1 Tax=Lactobacillus delbrueckii TaxID=1584 RepID=UPI001E64D066|nr:hypothetical protein [Lactobacillus delbrueckii]MCD5492133.1 hypothetical protein [Lactobacillus delbrueckii subsp. lactis]